jgi:hypothetical protein
MLSPQVEGMYFFYFKCSAAVAETGYDNRQKKIGHDDLKLKNAKMLCSSIKFLSNLWDSIWKW